MLIASTRHFFGSLVLSLGLAASAAAQTSPALPVPIRPGDARLDVAHLPMQPETYRCFYMQNGQTAQFKLVSQLYADAARHRLTRVQVKDFGAGRTMIDSTVADLATLRPLYMSGRMAGVMTMELHFTGQQVRASVARNGAPAQVATHTMPQPYFDSNLSEIVFRLLPLAPGLRATIPCYEYEEAGQTVYRVLSVREDYLLGPDERLQKTWLVDMDQDQKTPFTLWLDQKNHELLKAVYYIGPGKSMVTFKVPAGTATADGRTR